MEGLGCQWRRGRGGRAEEFGVGWERETFREAAASGYHDSPIRKVLMVRVSGGVKRKRRVGTDASPAHGKGGAGVGGGLAVLAFDGGFHTVEDELEAAFAGVGVGAVADGVGEGLGEAGDALVEVVELEPGGFEGGELDGVVGGEVSGQGGEAGDVGFEVGSDLDEATLAGFAGLLVRFGIGGFLGWLGTDAADFVGGFFDGVIALGPGGVAFDVGE